MKALLASTLLKRGAWYLPGGIRVERHVIGIAWVGQNFVCMGKWLHWINEHLQKEYLVVVWNHTLLRPRVASQRVGALTTP